MSGHESNTPHLSRLSKSAISGSSARKPPQGTRGSARTRSRRSQISGSSEAFNMNGRRAYRLEDLDAYVESLPGWYDSTGERSAKVVGDRRVS